MPSQQTGPKTLTIIRESETSLRSFTGGGCSGPLITFPYLRRRRSFRNHSDFFHVASVKTVTLVYIQKIVTGLPSLPHPRPTCLSRASSTAWMTARDPPRSRSLWKPLAPVQRIMWVFCSSCYFTTSTILHPGRGLFPVPSVTVLNELLNKHY